MLKGFTISNVEQWGNRSRVICDVYEGEEEKVVVNFYSKSKGGINRGWLIVWKKWEIESRETGEQKKYTDFFKVKI